MEHGTDILFVIAPPFDVNMPPYVLAQPAEYLQCNGLSVQMVDLNIEIFRHSQDTQKNLWERGAWNRWASPLSFPQVCRDLDLDVDRIAAGLCDEKAPCIYFYAQRESLPFLQKVARKIRTDCPDITLIFGGPASSIEGERAVLNDELADFFIVGEVEASLLELVRRLIDNRPLDHIRGVIRPLPDGKDHFTPREPEPEPSVFGFPTYRHLDLAQYESEQVPILAGRGCAYRCAFCAEQPAQGVFRNRPARHIYEEMLAHYENLNVMRFEFQDLVIDGDTENLGALCDLIIEGGQPFVWAGQMAPRADLSEPFFKKMHSAGCNRLVFGVESFSDALLASMNKRYSAADAIDNLRWAHAAGIETHINLIVGFPGEKNQDLYNTADAVKRHVEVIDFVDTVLPCDLLPGSLMERNPARWDIFLYPDDRRPSAWDTRNQNNAAWRDKRAKELAIYIAGLPVRFHYDDFVAKNNPLRKMETRIRARFEKRIRTQPQVMLISMPPWGFENPPVALAYLTTYLKTHNVPCDLMDFNIDMYNDVGPELKMLWHVENKNYWSNEKTFQLVRRVLSDQLDRAVEAVLEVNPPLLGFSVVDPKERITIAFIKMLRHDGYKGKIVLGGPACHTPDYRQIFIDEAGDLINGYCVGEGEQTLLEAARCARDGGNLADVAGLMTPDKNGECRYEPREFIEDLDSIPHPTYAEFDHSIYPGDSLILEWSRGCVGTCTYCKGREIAGPYRSRSADHIFAELKHHYDVNGYDNFTICDPVINGSPGVLDALCDRIVDEKLPIRWNGEGIPRPSLTAKLLNKMAAAGCYELQLGLECGSDSVLKRMGKRRLFSVEEAAQVVRDCHEAGIKTCLFIIVGFPGETEQEFEKTLEFIDGNADWIDQVKSINSLHIVTDTPIHKHADTFGLTLPERDYHYLWTDSNGMDWPERNRRIRRVLSLCEKHGIEVRETNLAEGKQLDLADAIGEEIGTIEEQTQRLIRQINDLRSFEVGDAGDGLSDHESKHPSLEGAPEDTEPIEVEAPTDFADPEQKDAFVEQNLALAGVLSGERVYSGPEVLEIDLTNACNCNCVGCWNHSDMLGDDKYTGEKFRRRLPIQTVLDTIDQAAAMGAKKVQLSGAGEPFMHPDILTVIERIKEHGLVCNIISNFTLVDLDKAKRLVDLGVDDITVSVWAGTPAMYKATHPKSKGKTLYKIRETLRAIHAFKAEQKKYHPHIKIYNVISKVNAAGITDMVDFALSCYADFIEFTPIDIIEGKTDQLALDNNARDLIAAQLHALTSREDYLELDPAQDTKERKGSAEGKEFARFIKRDLLLDWFKFDLEDISRFDVLCPRKEWKLDVEEDNVRENALLFYYPHQECDVCPMADNCPIDKERHVVKVEFLSVLGFGSFYRRITSPTADTGAYDSVVKDLPCLVGWTYARLLTDGSVIPCCKGDDMPLGNLSDGDFKSIWTSLGYRDFRTRAKQLPKDAPFFKPIDCLSACDNLGQNLQTLERLKNLSDYEKGALVSPDKDALDKD